MSQKKNLNPPEPQIIFADNDLIAVDKPTGVLTIPDHWDHARLNLWQWLQEKHPTEKIFVVHRLDVPTSGIVLFAKSPAVHQNLCTQFEEHRIQKIYYGIVEGILPGENGEIDFPLMEKKNKPGTMQVNLKTGKPSLTGWEMIERFQKFSYIKILPQTGRTHQIRVHFSQIGYPLLVDDKYGSSAPIFLSQIKQKFNFKKGLPELPLLNRLALHAGEIRFIHPITSELLTLSCEIPRDLQVFLKQLRKYNSIR